MLLDFLACIPIFEQTRFQLNTIVDMRKKLKINMALIVIPLAVILAWLIYH